MCYMTTFSLIKIISLIFFVTFWIIFVILIGPFWRIKMGIKVFYGISMIIIFNSGAKKLYRARFAKPVVFVYFKPGRI